MKYYLKMDHRPEFKIKKHKTSIRKQEKSLGPWIRQRVLRYDTKGPLKGKQKSINWTSSK